MSIKKFLASMLLISKLSMVNASLSSFEFPENFERDYPETYQMLQTMEISPKANKLFEDIRKQHGILKVNFTDDCRTDGYYPFGTSQISISNELIDNIEKFGDIFIWEACNSVNENFNSIRYFEISKDENAFFIEAAEHKTCTDNIEIFHDYLSQARDYPEIKEKIEQACGKSIEILIDERVNDPQKKFKAYWDYVNSRQNWINYPKVFTHAQMYRDDCYNDLDSTANFQTTRHKFSKLYDFYSVNLAMVKNALEKNKVNKSKNDFKTIVNTYLDRFKIADDHCNKDRFNVMLHGSVDSQSLIKVIDYAASDWNIGDTVPHLSQELFQYYKNLNNIIVEYNTLVNLNFKLLNSYKVLNNPAKVNYNSQQFKKRAMLRKHAVTDL